MCGKALGDHVLLPAWPSTYTVAFVLFPKRVKTMFKRCSGDLNRGLLKYHLVNLICGRLNNFDHPCPTDCPSVTSNFLRVKEESAA